MDNQTLTAALSGLTGTTASPELTTSQDEPKPKQLTAERLTSCLSERDNPRFRSRVFDLDESHPKVLTMARWSEAFLKAAARNDRGNGTALALHGPVGTGKTHVCRKVANALNSWAPLLWESGFWPGHRVPFCKFSTWSVVIEMEKYGFDDWLDEAKESSWIVLNDVGSEVDKWKSGEPVERLRRVLDLARTKWMLVSTNVPKAKWPHVFDARVADRLMAFKALDLAGVPSRRAKASL